jgi:cell division protein FtsZ
VEEAATRIREEADQDANIIVGATFDDSLEGIVRVSVVATGIDNTSVTQQPQAKEGALTNLAEKLLHGSRHTANRSQQDSSFRPIPITPSLLGPAQAEPSMASTAEPLRTPRIDELTQNEIRAAERKVRDDSPPDKRGKTLMQRLVGRTEAGNSIDEDSLNIPAYVGRRVTTL